MIFKRTSFFLLVFLFIPTTFAFAESNDSFYVEPVINEELQIEGKGFMNYDVSNFEGEKLNSSFVITNESDKTITVLPTVRNGLTTVSGNLSNIKLMRGNMILQETYYPGGETRLSGFLNDNYMLSNFITDLPNEITLKPFESKEIQFTIHIPKNLSGVMIGGLGFVEKNDKRNQDNNETLSIQLQKGYVFGIWLYGKEIEKFNDIEINDIEVMTEGKSPIVFPVVENNNPAPMKNRVIEYKVVYQETDEVIFEGKETLDVITPFNYLKYPLFWEGEVKEGRYKLIIDGKTFDFEITDENVDEMAELNSSDADTVITQSEIPVWIWVLISILVALLLVLLFIIWKKKKEEKDEEAEEETKAVKNK